MFNPMMYNPMSQPQQQMGPPAPQQMGPQPPQQMGPPAPGPQMPAAYSQNRMAEAGAPAIAQIGEALFDRYRANQWRKENSAEVDETGNSMGGSTGAPKIEGPSAPVGGGSPSGDFTYDAPENTLAQMLMKAFSGQIMG